MPYINEDKKNFLESSTTELSNKIEDYGDLNYVITKLSHALINKRGLSYDTINSVIGAIKCAGNELYRRVAIPYEEEKIKQNGDVFDVALKK